MAGYDDPNDEGNSAKYHTGKPCIDGCGRPAGTAWSPHWCFECNVARINRVTGQLKGIQGKLHQKGYGGRIGYAERTIDCED